MAVPQMLMLHSGGLRSLVAMALTLRTKDRPRLTLLHIVDGRQAGRARLRSAQRQAEQFKVKPLVTLDMPQLFGHNAGYHSDGQPLGPLARSQMLLAALAQSQLTQSQAVIWPAACNGEFHAIAKVGEQALLLEQQAELEAGVSPRIETPLLELNDQQIIELGAQLGVPWEMAWSCLMSDDQACGLCGACHRRKLAFEKAGIADGLP